MPSLTWYFAQVRSLWNTAFSILTGLDHSYPRVAICYMKAVVPCSTYDCTISANCSSNGSSAPVCHVRSEDAICLSCSANTVTMLSTCSRHEDNVWWRLSTNSRFCVNAVPKQHVNAFSELRGQGIIINVSILLFPLFSFYNTWNTVSECVLDVGAPVCMFAWAAQAPAS